MEITMREVGIRELKAHLSEVLEAVEAGETIGVTNHGRLVAHIVPTNRLPSSEQIAEALDSVNRLAEDIGRYVPEGMTAEQIINDIRS
jgi:prevent-host-death family protein